MHYINTIYQGTDCTVFGVSAQSTAIDWSNLLHREYETWFYLSDEPLQFALMDVAPHLYSKYRRHILYNTDPNGMSKPQLVVLEGGKT